MRKSDRTAPFVSLFVHFCASLWLFLRALHVPCNSIFLRVTFALLASWRFKCVLWFDLPGYAVSMPNEHWWNADFDLALQPGREPSADPGLEAQVHELSLHALTAAAPGDSVLLFEAPPDDFLSYLTQRDIQTPEISIVPEIRSSFQFRPYGWGPQAIALNEHYDQSTSAPPLEAVRRVNGRSFAHRIERQVQGSDVPRGKFTSPEHLQSLLQSEPERPDGWVAKTEHGNAALGNRRLRTRQLGEGDIRWLGPRLEQEPMVLEWWLERTKDLCAVFNVSPGGQVEDFAVHETIHTADGGFIGALYDGTIFLPEEWHETLRTNAETVAAALHQEGYFGPVCVDALAWDDCGSPRVRPLVDLNARRHASEGWRRLAEQWGGCLYGRFFSTRKLRLPPTYDEFERALGEDAWNPSTCSGVIATSPLWLEGPGNRRRPRKLGIVFREQSREGVFAMEKRFREVFEK